MRESLLPLKLMVALMTVLSISASMALAQSKPATWELIVCAARDDLPYSNELQQGFENQIMALLAQDLHAELTYLWLPKVQVTGQNRLLLAEGRCDALLDVGDASGGFLTTLPYYQTTYYFIYRSDAPFDILSFDDVALTTLRIGVETYSPPDIALGARGFIDSVHHYYPDSGRPAARMIEDIVNKKIDVAIVFGPLAQSQADLTIVPVAPQVESYALSMVAQTAMGLRQADTDLRDLLNQALASQWDEIQQVLEEHDIPVLPLPRPVRSIGG